MAWSKEHENSQFAEKTRRVKCCAIPFSSSFIPSLNRTAFWSIKTCNKGSKRCQKTDLDPQKRQRDLLPLPPIDLHQFQPLLRTTTRIPWIPRPSGLFRNTEVRVLESLLSRSQRTSYRESQYSLFSNFILDWSNLLSYLTDSISIDIDL